MFNVSYSHAFSYSMTFLFTHSLLYHLDLKTRFNNLILRARELETHNNHAEALRVYVQAMHIRPGDLKLERKISNLSRITSSPSSTLQPPGTPTHPNNGKPLQILNTPSHLTKPPQTATKPIQSTPVLVEPKNIGGLEQIKVGDKQKKREEPMDEARKEDNSGRRRIEVEQTQGEQVRKVRSEKKERTATVQEEEVRSIVMQPDGYFHDPDNNAYVLKSKDEGAELSVSTELYKHLFDYQREGIKWMWGLFISANGGILGDDMGLGKTMQVVGFLGSMIRSGHITRALVVTPVSVLEHWKSELEKWGEGIRVKVFHGTSKKDRETSLQRVQSR